MVSGRGGLESRLPWLAVSTIQAVSFVVYPPRRFGPGDSWEFLCLPLARPPSHDDDSDQGLFQGGARGAFAPPPQELVELTY